MPYTEHTEQLRAPTLLTLETRKNKTHSIYRLFKKPTKNVVSENKGQSSCAPCPAHTQFDDETTACIATQSSNHTASTKERERE